MCTAISYNGFFGRTLDYECGFGENATVIPRGHRFEFRHRAAVDSEFAIAGMARTEKGYPLFFDAVNEKGVAMAGLNFVGYAYFSKGQSGDVSVFEFIPYVLSQAKSVEDARSLINGIRISDTPFSDTLPAAQLHWMIADKEQSITVESTKNGVNVYSNAVGVLTNNPPFPYQMMHLNNYLSISARPAINRFSDVLELNAVSRGMGAMGLPGDWSSQSRFVRAAFVRNNASKENSVAHFFRMISSVSVPKGCMLLENGDAEYTRYTSCMDLSTADYYYTEYGDMTVKKISARQ